VVYMLVWWETFQWFKVYFMFAQNRFNALWEICGWNWGTCGWIWWQPEQPLPGPCNRFEMVQKALVFRPGHTVMELCPESAPKPGSRTLRS
jgi:hypothetical protein